VITWRWASGSAPIACSITVRVSAERSSASGRPHSSGGDAQWPDQAVLRAAKALGRDRRPRILDLLARERRERHRAALPDAAGLREVHDDAEEPGAQRRAALEAVDPAQQADPRLLDDFFGHGPVAHVKTRDAQHGGAMILDELRESALVAVAERADELRFVEGE
jgi:hypothetical protein